MKQAHRQASRYHGSIASAAAGEVTHEAERILMVHFAPTQVQAKEVAQPTSREGGQDEATATKPSSTSPPLTADGV
jgi:hypothetical protein